MARIKRENEVTLGEAIRYFIQEMGMEEQILESMALDAWYEMMGEFTQKYTSTLYIKKKVLFVKIDLPALKNELSYGKSKIIEHINQSLQKEYLQDIRFI